MYKTNQDKKPRTNYSNVKKVFQLKEIEQNDQCLPKC